MEVNKLLVGDSRAMIEVQDSSIDLVITSPPYNVGMEYEEELKQDDYLAKLCAVFFEVRRVLKPDGRVCVNIAGTGRDPYVPLQSYINNLMIETLGYKMRGEIIWDKGSSVGSSTAWGSWQSASNPSLRDVHEYILIYSKDKMAKSFPGRSDITKQEFMEYTKSIWRMPTASAMQLGHPAPFPVELPSRLIKLYSNKEDVVLDPFVGSGTTAVAALQLGRAYIGYDINAEYVAAAEHRLRQVSGSLDL